jgi:hypothetical protein
VTSAVLVASVISSLDSHDEYLLPQIIVSNYSKFGRELLKIGVVFVAFYGRSLFRILNSFSVILFFVFSFLCFVFSFSPYVFV